MDCAVQFYFPDTRGGPPPATLAAFPAWQRQLAAAGIMLGPSAWIVQTQLQLAAAGVPCSLTSSVPQGGIIVAHAAQMPRPLPVSRERYWVCVLADHPRPNYYCNFHLLQNPAQTVRTHQPSAYVPHWPQPALRVRDPARGARLENIYFFGEAKHLCAEIRAEPMQQWLAAHGWRLVVPPRDAWHDYGDSDVVLAVRSFGNTDWHHDKPATKLVNAWHAGVPAILGIESAYRIEGRVNESYLEADSIAALQRQLQRLRDVAGLRESLVAEGRLAAAAYTTAALAGRWNALLEQELVPRWRARQRQYWWRSATERLLGRVEEGLGWRMSLLGGRPPP